MNALAVCGFTKEYVHFRGSMHRGTAGAIGRFAMKSLMNDITPEPNETTASATSCDWLMEHGDYLFNLAVGQVRNACIAEDLVQETFLAAIKAHDRFSGRSSARTWLVGILRHKIYDHLRKLCRERPARADYLDADSARGKEAWDHSVLWVHEVAGECMQPSRRMELAEFRQSLEVALGKLPPRIAQVFQLYEIEERPNREVCDRLKISESNLWVMLHRARKQLREELSDWKSQAPRSETVALGA
jgi:RNA polymerase sigma-70 factor (ECF subfamily)